MGNGSKLPFALIVALSAGLSGACYDFHDPAFPESGAPVVLHTNLRVTEQRGVQLEAFLTPGLDQDGFSREVETEVIVLMGSAVGPRRVREQDVREYVDSVALADRIGVQPVTLSSPRVRRIQAPPPEIRWFVPQRLDPDTIAVDAGSDLVLRVLPEAAASSPAPQIRQWSVQVTGESTVFTAGSNGLVPAEIRIPAYWLPAPDSADRLRAVLTVYMAGLQRPAPGDYMANINLDTRLTWNIRIRR